MTFSLFQECLDIWGWTLSKCRLGTVWSQTRVAVRSSTKGGMVAPEYHLPWTETFVYNHWLQCAGLCNLTFAIFPIFSWPDRDRKWAIKSFSQCDQSQYIAIEPGWVQWDWTRKKLKTWGTEIYHSVKTILYWGQLPLNDCLENPNLYSKISILLL